LQKSVFWTFWRFSGWLSARLALILAKMHLQHDSLPFLPLASRFVRFWLGHARPMPLGFSNFEIFISPFLFLFFFSFCCGDWPPTGLAFG